MEYVRGHDANALNGKVFGTGEELLVAGDSGSGSAAHGRSFDKALSALGLTRLARLPNEEP